MKPDEERAFELWRAFFLGVRATLVAHDIRLSNRALKMAVDKMVAVANGEETIYDPAADSAFFSGDDSGEKIHLAFRADRDLAQTIAEAFEQLRRD